MATLMFLDLSHCMVSSTATWGSTLVKSDNSDMNCCTWLIVSSTPVWSAYSFRNGSQKPSTESSPRSIWANAPLSVWDLMVATTEPCSKLCFSSKRSKIGCGEGTTTPPRSKMTALVFGGLGVRVSICTEKGLEGGRQTRVKFLVWKREVQLTVLLAALSGLVSWRPPLHTNRHLLKLDITKNNLARSTH